jgi:hypothetical protein
MLDFDTGMAVFVRNGIDAPDGRADGAADGTA